MWIPQSRGGPKEVRGRRNCPEGGKTPNIRRWAPGHRGCWERGMRSLQVGACHWNPIARAGAVHKTENQAAGLLGCMSEVATILRTLERG